jgi:AcrR family transcriptional regulator
VADRKQEILDAALAIADERGIDAISMRAVADRVGLTPMALYPHVGDKSGLLDGLVGRILSELPVPDSGTDWRDRLDALAHAARGVAKRHPAAVGLLFSRPGITPDAVRVIDAVYQALLDAGVSPAQVPRLERMFSTLVLGYGMSEASGRFSTGELDPRGRRGQLPEGALPGHQALAEYLDRPVDWDAEFAADVDDLARVIEASSQQSGS